MNNGRDMPWCQGTVRPLKKERRCHHKQFVCVFEYVDIANHDFIPNPVYVKVHRRGLCKEHYDKLVQYGDANLNIGKITGLLI